MESQHSVGAPTSRDFPRFADIAAWSRKSLTTFTQKLTFLEKDPLRANVQKCFPKRFTTSQIHVLCANFVKFSWPEFGKVVRYLHDKKIKFLVVLPLSLLRGSRLNLSGPAPDNILGLPQISSKSVHFRWSYSRKRERRWNATQSVSNTRRSYSFFGE